MSSWPLMSFWVIVPQVTRKSATKEDKMSKYLLERHGRSRCSAIGIVLTLYFGLGPKDRVWYSVLVCSKLVGEARFKLAASASQTQHSDLAELLPEGFSPVTIRAQDLTFSYLFLECCY